MWSNWDGCGQKLESAKILQIEADLGFLLEDQSVVQLGECNVVGGLGEGEARSRISKCPPR